MTTRIAAALCAWLPALAAAAAFAPVDAPGEEPAGASREEPAREPGAGRTLNGHRFMPSAAVAQPFATTSLGSFLLVGVGSTTGRVQVGQRTFAGTYDYAGLGGVLSYEQAFLDHFSARVAIQDFIYSGINGESALVVGSGMQAGGAVGATATFQLGDSVRAGVLLDVGYAPNLALTIASGVSSIVDSCAGPQGCVVEPGQVFAVRRVLTVQPVAAVSWAPLRSLGVTAAAGLLAATTSGETQVDGQAIVAGGAVDFDFLTVSSVPIGLLAQCNLTAPVSGSGLESVLDVGGGIYYTGRKDLSAGVQILVRRFALTPSLDVSWSTILAALGLRYYW